MIIDKTTFVSSQVVLMNQVTTKISPGRATRLVPALGDGWAHAATNRIILYWQEDVRRAFIYKSTAQPPRTAEYLVTAEGVRGHRYRSHTNGVETDKVM